MSNALLAFDTAVTPTLSVFPWPSSYDLTLLNLRTPNLSEKWVSPSLASIDTRAWFAFPTGAAAVVSLFALVNHNLSLAATVRLTGSNNGFSGLAYDSGVLPAFPAGVTQARRAGLRWTWWHRLSVPTGCQSWRIEISDASNPAGFVSAGRLFAAQQLWQPTVNMSSGASIGFEGGADVQTALNGAEWFTEREPFRVVRFKLGAMPLAEMLDGAFNLNQVAAGARREVLMVYEPDDTSQAVRRTVFGRLRQLSPIEEPQPLALAASFELKELL